MSAPSLAGSLGRLASPVRATRYDDVRLGLLDALVAAKRGGRLDGDAWRQAFEDAARSLRMRVLADAESALRQAAFTSRYPRRKLARRLPDADHADALLHRLLAEGMSLETVTRGDDDVASHRARAAALEAAWEGMLAAAAAESARWHAAAAEMAAWRRSLTPLYLGGGAALLLALLLAAWLGGVLPAPAWFSPFAQLWWSVPWP